MTIWVVSPIHSLQGVGQGLTNDKQDICINVTVRVLPIMCDGMLYAARLAQLVEHSPYKRETPGSSLGLAACFSYLCYT